MKPVRIIYAAIVFFVIALQTSPAQKVGFISSETIRSKFPEAKQAEQRIQSVVEEWKRELASLQKQIENAQFEMNKNRLVWADAERVEKEKDLEQLKMQREAFARAKFEAGGEYDLIVKQMMTPVEEKIYAAVQEIAANEAYDIILDQSLQPLPYVNFKYDMTVKVLRRLGVDVEELEKELKDKIEKDPRNKTKESKTPRKVKRGGTDDNSKDSDSKDSDDTDKGKKPEKEFDKNPNIKEPPNSPLDRNDPNLNPMGKMPPQLPSGDTTKLQQNEPPD